MNIFFKSVALSLTIFMGGCIATMPDNQLGADSSRPITKKWICEAPNMISGRYSGGEYANIHLSPFSSGGAYKVTKDGDLVTGITANGTKFVCK